jgi:mRNA interferase RelE/StbE
VFAVRLDRKPEKFVKQCQPKLKQRLFALFETLEENPVPVRQFDVRKIEGEADSYRIRLSSFRLLYKVFWNEKTVRVTKIERRKDRTYKF